MHDRNIMVFGKAIVFAAFLLNIQLASAGKQEHQTVCLTSEDCLKQSEVLTIIGVTHFSAGDYESFGCFYEGNTAYFGRGGTIDDILESSLAGGRARIWCQAKAELETRAPTDSPSTVKPTTAEPTVVSTADYLEIVTSEHPTASPSTNPPDPTASPSMDSLAPTTSPSFSPTFSPTVMVSSEQYLASSSPSPKPTDMMPTSRPTKEPSRPPSLSPSIKLTAVPTKMPSSQPSKRTTNAPSPSPSSKPTAIPTKMPTSAASESESTTPKACRNQKKCKARSKQLGYVKYYVGNYDAKGCYSKGDAVYFGVGGTVEQKSTSSLAGGKERIWCGAEQSNQSAPKITNSPVSSPSSVGSIANLAPPKEYCIDIEVVTDEFGGQTGFYLSHIPIDGSDPEKLLEVAIGSLESETKYSRQVCVPKGKYTFTIEDMWNGVCCSYGKGSYSVSIDGGEVISGGYFRMKTVSHEIIAGYDPEASDRDEEWLRAHNTRREAFHKAHNTEYRPLHWSPELANDASVWVDKILPTCKIIRESGLEEGENMSVRRFHKQSDDERPDDVLVRWSDRPLELEKEYPDNQTMTQLMWRATRYVGCSDKFTQLKDGSYCYVSICRYKRPGNCSVRKYENWLIPTLLDRTPCGVACPKAGCY